MPGGITTASLEAYADFVVVASHADADGIEKPAPGGIHPGEIQAKQAGRVHKTNPLKAAIVPKKMVEV